MGLISGYGGSCERSEPILYLLYNENMKISEFVDECKANNLSYAVLKNWHQPTPTWDEFKSLYDPNTEEGRISIKDRAYTDIFKYFLDQSKDAYPNVDYDFFLMECPSYRNLDPANCGTYQHTDPVDTLHWQGRGVSEWFMGEDMTPIILEPGDLIWFAANTKHKVENLTEKCSLIFSQSYPAEMV